MGGLISTNKPELPLYRVSYSYMDWRMRNYAITVPAESPEDACLKVRARMGQDGYPMDRITITGATLNALT